MREQFQAALGVARGCRGAASREAADKGSHPGSRHTGDAVSVEHVLAFSHAEEPVGAPRYFGWVGCGARGGTQFEHIWQRAHSGGRVAGTQCMQ